MEKLKRVFCNIYPNNSGRILLPYKITPIQTLITVANITAPAEISFAIPTILEYLL